MQWDRDIESADYIRLSHDTGCYPAAPSGPRASRAPAGVANLAGQNS
jgi:hypothetical protein